MGKQLRRLKRATKQVFGQKQDKQKYIGGLLGTYIDGVETVKVSDRPGYVYVRLGGSESEVIQAVNGVVKEAFDLKVLVTIHPYNPGIYQIVGIDMGQYRSQTTTAFSLPAHGDTHSLGDGSDPVFIYRKQMRQPLQAHPTTPKGNTLYVEPDFFRWGDTTKFWPGGYTADLTLANPSAGLGRYVTIYLAGETNSIGYITGSTFSNITGAISNIPLANPVTQGIPLAAVFLNSITDEIDWDSVVDIRMFLELGGVTLQTHGLDPIHGFHSGTIRSSLSTVVDSQNFYTGTVVEDVLQEIGQKTLYAVNGTGTANKVAIFHDIDTIKSYTGFNYDGSTLSLDGNLQATGSGYFHTVRTNSLFISGSNFILESNMDIAPAGAGVGQALVFDGTRWEPGDIAAGTGSASSLGWFNVQDYGAIGDGVTNDTVAVQNAINALTVQGGGILYFPFGEYLTNGGFELDVPCIVRGDGNTSEFGTITLNAASEVISNSPTGTLFTVSDNGVSFEDLALTCSHSTPTNGAGISIDTPASTNMFVHSHIRNCTINGFYYNIDFKTAFMWHLDGCYILNPMAVGIRINNEFWPDWGDFTISNSIFHPGPRNNAVAVQHIGGGGMLLTNTKFDGWVESPNPPPQPPASDVYKFERQIDTKFRGDSSNIQIANCSFENWNIDAIRIITTGTVYCGNIVINGCQFGGYNATGSAVVMTADTLGYLERVIISDNIFHTNTSTAPTIALTKVQKVRFDGNINDGFPTFLSQTGCADVLNFELADFSQTVYDSANIDLGTTVTGSYTNVDAANAKISFTPPSYGRYRVTFTFSHHMDGTGIEVFFKLNDGTTSSPAIATYNASGVSERPITISHIFAWQPTAQTVTLQKRVVSGSPINVNQIPNNSTVEVELGLAMSVERIGT